MDAPRNILVIISGALGDMIVATPALRAIRHAAPHAHITYYTNPLMRQIAPEGVFADALITDDARGSKNLFTFFSSAMRLRREHFDMAINLRYTSERSALLAFFSRAHVRAGAGPRQWMRCYTQRLPYPPSHYNELYRYTIVSALGFPVEDFTPYVHCTAQHRAFAEAWQHESNITTPFVCIHPGASRAYRAWLPERYAEIGRRIADDLTRVSS